MQSKETPIFIVGNSRSGISVMGRVLGSHPDICTFIHEIHFFDEIINSNELFNEISENKAVEIYTKLLSIIKKGYFVSKKDRILFLSEAKGKIVEIKEQKHPLTLSNIYKGFLFYYTLKENKKIPREQTPRYLFFIKDIFKIFPEAKIIIMVRDPRDVLLSQKNKWRLRFLGHRHIPLMEVISGMV